MKRFATITGMVVCLLGVATIAQASTHHPKGITQAQAAKQYLADVAPSNALPQSTKAPAYAAAVDKLDTLLLSQRWPSGTRADIRALVVADAAVVGDYNAFRVPTFSMGQPSTPRPRRIWRPIRPLPIRCGLTSGCRRSGVLRLLDGLSLVFGP